MQSNLTSGDPLSLERIRLVLTRLEDTIIFGLIERAQFAHNPRIYLRGAFKELATLGFEGSWLEWFLKEIETFHAKARRYARYICPLYKRAGTSHHSPVQMNIPSRQIYRTQFSLPCNTPKSYIRTKSMPMHQ